MIGVGGGLSGWRPFGGGARDGVLVPQSRLSGPTLWVMAIMVALMVVASATGLALRRMAATAEADLSGGVTVQIIEAQVVARNAQTAAAVQALRAMPGVEFVRAVPQGEVEQLLAPWLGAGMGDNDLVPVPALIDVRLEARVDAARVAALRAALRKVAPAARVDAQASWLDPVFSAVDSLRWLAVAMVGLLGVAMAAAVLLSTRSALGAHRSTIDIIHNLGGTDAQIARIFQRMVGMDAALGGVIGLVVGVLAVLGLGARFAALGAGLVAGGALAPLDWAVLALVPVGAAALAMVTARISVLVALRRML